jgi:hypothetical protein
MRLYWERFPGHRQDRRATSCWRTEPCHQGRRRGETGERCPKSAPAAGSPKRTNRPMAERSPAAANAMFRAKSFDFIRVILAGRRRAT